jgi:hypothetical protein
MQSDTRENYSDIGTKTIPERNTLQLRCDSAKQHQRHECGPGCQLREANSSRYCIERSSSFNLSVRPCSAESTSQPWDRTPAGEICVHDSPARCLHYDSTTSKEGLSVMSKVQSQHQRWDTLRSGQLQLSGIDVCLGLLDPQSTQSDTAAVPFSITPFLTIVFGHPSLELNFRVRIRLYVSGLAAVDLQLFDSESRHWPGLPFWRV